MEFKSESEKEPVPLFTLFFVCFLIYWLPILINWLFVVCDLRLNLTGRILLQILAAMVFIWLVRDGIDRPKKEELGLSGEHPMIMAGLGFGVLGAVFLAWLFYVMFFAALQIDFGDSELDRTPEMFLFVVILGPLWEELIYRVNALTLLSRRYRPMQASFIVAVWFIAKHFLNWYNNGTSAEWIVASILFSIVAWTLVDYLFLKYRSILIPLVFHMGWNLMSFLTGPLCALDLLILLLAGVIFLTVPHTIFNHINSLAGKEGIQCDTPGDVLEQGLALFKSLFQWDKEECLFLSVVMMIVLVLATEPLQIILHPFLDYFLLAFLLCLIPVLWVSIGFRRVNNFSRGVDNHRLRKWKPVVRVRARDGRIFYYFQYSMKRKMKITEMGLVEECDNEMC